MRLAQRVGRGPQQVALRAAVARICGDARAEGRAEGGSVGADEVFVLQRVEDLGQSQYRDVTARAVHADHEPVVVPARRHVVTAEALQHQLGHVTQHQIAGCLPVSIAQLTETIDFEHCQRNRRRLTRGQTEELVEGQLRFVPRRQTGEWVVLAHRASEPDPLEPVEDAGEQLRPGHGFGQIIVGPGREDSLDDFELGSHRQEENRQALPARIVA